MFSIKDASKMLDCTTQNIYRQKNELIAKGLMEQSNTGAYFLNEQGINYLKEKRIETIKSSQDFKEVANQDFASVASPTVSTNNADYISVLKEQIQDLKNDRNFWYNEYIRKDTELQAKNDYIQELNIKAFALLGVGEKNEEIKEENNTSIIEKKEIQETKKSFFEKINPFKK